MNVTPWIRWQTLRMLILQNRTGDEFQSVYPLSEHRDGIEGVPFRFADAKLNTRAIGLLDRVSDANSDLRAASV